MGAKVNMEENNLNAKNNEIPKAKKLTAKKKDKKKVKKKPADVNQGPNKPNIGNSHIESKVNVEENNLNVKNNEVPQKKKPQLKSTKSFSQDPSSIPLLPKLVYSRGTQRNQATKENGNKQGEWKWNTSIINNSKKIQKVFVVALQSLDRSISIFQKLMKMKPKTPQISDSLKEMNQTLNLIYLRNSDQLP